MQNQQPSYVPLDELGFNDALPDPHVPADHPLAKLMSLSAKAIDMYCAIRAGQDAVLRWVKCEQWLEDAPRGLQTRITFEQDGMSSADVYAASIWLEAWIDKEAGGLRNLRVEVVRA